MKRTFRRSKLGLEQTFFHNDRNFSFLLFGPLLATFWELFAKISHKFLRPPHTYIFFGSAPCETAQGVGADTARDLTRAGYTGVYVRHRRMHVLRGQACRITI